MYASEGAWFPAPHLEFISDVLLQVVRGEILRLAVSTPPQHGKSEFISKYFPTWYLGRFPTHRLLQFSYGQDLTLEWTGAGRDLFARHGPAVFGLDTWARSKRTAWNAYRAGRRTGGGVRGVGKGGGVSGRPVDLGLGDDMVKDWEEASSPAQRERADKWFRSAVLPRAKKLVMIGTRWHHDDVLGRLEQRQRRGEVGEPWRFINLPAVALDEDPLGRQRGAPLWPNNPLCMADAGWYAKKEREVGPYVWSALYQGRPSPEQGMLFEKRWFAYFEEERGHFIADRIRTPAETLHRFVTVDPAWSKKTSADYSALMAWGLDRLNNRLFLLDVVRKRLSAPEIERELRDLMERKGAAIAYIEAQNLKLEQMEVLRRSGIPMREVQVNTDKVSRFIPVQAHAARGALLFRQGAPWLADLERELLEFGPSCDHDDQADAISAAVKVANEFAGRRGLIEAPDAAPRPPGLMPTLKRPT